MWHEKPGWLSALLGTSIPQLQLAIFFVLEIEVARTEKRTKITYECYHKFQISESFHNK